MKNNIPKLVMAAVVLAGVGCGPAEGLEDLAGVPTTAALSADPAEPSLQCFVTVEPDRLFQENPDGTLEVTVLRDLAAEGSEPAVTCIDLASPQPDDEQKLIGIQGTTIISEDYVNTSYGGSKLTHLASNDRGCNTYSCGFLGLSTCWYSYSTSQMPSGWNDVVSSTKGYAGCARNVIWEHYNYGGTRLECSYDCSSLGVMNDAASSRKWCRSGDSDCN